MTSLICTYGQSDSIFTDRCCQNFASLSKFQHSVHGRNPAPFIHKKTVVSLTIYDRFHASQVLHFRSFWSSSSITALFPWHKKTQVFWMLSQQPPPKNLISQSPTTSSIIPLILQKSTTFFDQIIPIICQVSVYIYFTTALLCLSNIPIIYQVSLYTNTYIYIYIYI